MTSILFTASKILVISFKANVEITFEFCPEICDFGQSYDNLTNALVQIMVFVTTNLEDFNVCLKAAFELAR